MLATTLDHIRAHHPCASGWEKLLKHLGKTRSDDDVLPCAVILDSNELDDALWCCRCEPQHHREWRLFAVWCGRQVQYLMRDPRSVAALDVATRHATGVATDEDLAAASAAAWDAWDAALAAARDAASAAARDAALAAARAAQARAFRQLVTTGEVPPFF